MPIAGAADRARGAAACDDRAVGDSRSVDKRAVAALVTAAVAGVVADQWGDVATWAPVAARLRGGLDGALLARALQAALLLAVYVVAPLGVARACGVGPGALGLGWGRSRRGLRTAALLVAAAAPVVIALSFLPGFARAYPIFRPAVAGGRALWAWLPLLAVMLFCVEVFYRGFLLAMLTPALGELALYVMVVPYALTHRDPIEALGAVGVGLVLGRLAQLAGSIWPALATHLSVALLIEAAAIWQAHR